MVGKIHALILEDNNADAELEKRELRKTGLDFEIQWVQDKGSFFSALDTFTPDLILADYSLPGFDGMTALGLARKRFQNIPVIIVSGAIGEEIAIETLKAGATDYVLKQRLSRLGPVVQRALQEEELVNERKRVEIALHESEERFRLLVEGVQDHAILMLDPEGKIASWNTGAERITGWSAKEVIGKHFSLFYTSQLAGKGEPQQALETAKTEGYFEAEIQHVHKDGTWFWADIAITALRAENGQLRGFAKIIRDITKRKQAEEAILQAKEEWERTFDCIPDLIAVLDTQQHILRANHAMAERLGLTAGQCVGQYCYMCVHGLNYRPGFCPFPLTVADSKQHEAEVSEPKLGGDFLVSTNPLLDSQGQVIGVVHVAHEITERKRMEEALRRSNETLERRVFERTAELAKTNEELKLAMQREKQMQVQLIQSEKYAALARLVASVAHELNNPIQTIQNCLYLIRQRIQPGSPVDGIVEMAGNESTRIGNLVQQLRETYRPAKDTTPVDFNLMDVVSRIHSLLEPQLRQNDIVWQMSSQTKNLPIHGIPDQIQQVVLNICLNAIDAIGTHGGQLSIDVSLLQDGQLAQVSFHDTGPGISSENIQKLFEPFFTTKEKGTGLGLAICYEIIKAHSGEIQVESQQGQGATFKVRLPVATAS